jgi:uncharacterized protein Yka (UPF0111/DUF47 family)
MTEQEKQDFIEFLEEVDDIMIELDEAAEEAKSFTGRIKRLFKRVINYIKKLFKKD